MWWQGLHGDHYIGEVYVGVPDATDTVKNRDREMIPLSFVGRPFSSNSTRWISGKINLNVSWGVDDDGKSLGPPAKRHCYY